MRPSGPSWYFLKWMLFLRKHETATVGNFTPVKTRSRLCSLKNCATTSPSPKKIPVGSICLERFLFYLPDFWFQPSNTHWWQATQATQPPFSCIFWMLHLWDHPSILGSQPRIHDFSRMKLLRKNGSTSARSCMDACRRWNPSRTAV